MRGSFRLFICLGGLVQALVPAGARAAYPAYDPNSAAPYYSFGIAKPQWGDNDQEQIAVAQSGRKFQGIYDNATELPTFTFLGLARSRIDIEIYEMQDPDFRTALRQAMSRGIRVRVIKDPAPTGETCKLFEPPAATDVADCLDQKRLAAEVRASGGSFIPFNKAALCGVPQAGQAAQQCFEHGKMILVDQKFALISTGNFNSSSFCNRRWNPARCNRDYSYISTDPETVRTLVSIFERDLVGVRYDVAALLTPTVQNKLTVSPISLAPLVAFIRSAERSIVLQNQYLHEATINQALIEAARRGVQVYVEVASLCAFGTPSADDITKNTAQFEQFDAAGIRSRFFTSSMAIDGRPGYLHAKAIVVDGRFGWVGSVNGSTTAVSLNREFGIFFRDPTMIAHLSQIMSQDFSHPQSENWRESLVCKKDRPTTSGGETLE